MNPHKDCIVRACVCVCVSAALASHTEAYKHVNSSSSNNDNNSNDNSNLQGGNSRVRLPWQPQLALEITRTTTTSTVWVFCLFFLEEHESVSVYNLGETNKQTKQNIFFCLCRFSMSPQVHVKHALKITCSCKSSETPGHRREPSIQSDLLGSTLCFSRFLL